MANVSGVVAALAAFGLAVLGLLLASEVPMQAFLPPLWSVAAIAVAPVVVIAASVLTQPIPAHDSADLRRAEAADAPRPRRNGGAVGGSTPGRRGMQTISRMAFEPSDGLTH